MKKKNFNVKSGRKKLLVFDYCTGFLSLLAILISLIGISMIREPEALYVLYGVCLMGSILLFTSIKHIIKYYRKEDLLFTYM